jgi:hypothetical protein
MADSSLTLLKSAADTGKMDGGVGGRRGAARVRGGATRVDDVDIGGVEDAADSDSHCRGCGEDAAGEVTPVSQLLNAELDSGVWSRKREGDDGQLPSAENWRLCEPQPGWSSALGVLPSSIACSDAEDVERGKRDVLMTRFARDHSLSSTSRKGVKSTAVAALEVTANAGDGQGSEAEDGKDDRAQSAVARSSSSCRKRHLVNASCSARLRTSTVSAACLVARDKSHNNSDIPQLIAVVAVFEAKVESDVMESGRRRM